MSKGTRHILVPLLAGVAAACAGGLVAGSGLGSLFAASALLVLLLPAFLPRASLFVAALGSSLLTLGAALIWALIPGRGDWWPGAVLLLEALLAAEAGLWFLLRRARLAPASAAGLAALTCFAWLSAPLWLFHLLAQWPALVQRLATVHPFFAFNALVPVENWTEMGIAYGLMDLNQDVPFALPQSMIPALLPCLAIALAGAVCRLRRG